VSRGNWDPHTQHCFLDRTDWRHPWLRINVLLREITHVVSRDRSMRQILRAELNRPCPCGRR
jgi:hypothetical protein